MRNLPGFGEIGADPLSKNNQVVQYFASYSGAVTSSNFDIEYRTPDRRDSSSAGIKSARVILYRQFGFPLLLVGPGRFLVGGHCGADRKKY